jgi:hypothetical protein
MSELDTHRIHQTVLAIPTLVDVRMLDATLPLFASPVRVDFTSLWGGVAADMAPVDLIAGWKALIPGFDATWHELGRIESRIGTDAATAACPVNARHWLGTEVWRVAGTYEFELRRAGRWQVSLMRFILAGETGNRGLTDLARSRTGT